MHLGSARGPARVPQVVRGLCIALAPLAACSSPSTPAEDRRLPEVLYVGATTDEALERMLARTAKDVAAERVAVDTPLPGASLPPSEPIVLSFHRALSAGLAPPPPLRSGPARSGRTASSVRKLADWFRPVGVAHAHGAPFNGFGYYLVISDAAERPQLRVFTDRLSYTVAASSATELSSAKQPLTLTLTSALFEANEVASGGGPFIAGSLEFRIE